MNSNFEWQKHQANERVQARLQDGAAHRRAKQGNDRVPFALPVRMAILVGVGVMVAIWLLTSCTTAAGTMEVDSETAVVAADGQAAREEIEIETEIEAGKATRWTMAERISFQDRREQYLAADMGHVIDPADRKLFNAGGSLLPMR